MSPRLLGAAVISLALGATTLTLASAARAENAAPSSTSAGSAAPASTPLGLRSTKPLELADEPAQTTLGWKLGALVVLGGFAAWAWKKRSTGATVADTSDLRILRRTSIGVRSELLVVEMDGQRLLLGVTPNAIQNLYIAPFTEDSGSAPIDEPLELVRPRPPMRDVLRKPVEEKPAVRRGTRQLPIEYVEEQARGLRAIAERK